MTRRAIVIVLDSVGIGEAPDTADFGDTGSNTLGNIAEAVGGLNLPNLARLGLGNIAHFKGIPPQDSPTATFGKLTEVSPGKDTTTGHWELMGIHLPRPFPLFPYGFPPEVMEPYENRTGRGWLGNYPASGTVIIEDLGKEHIETGKTIVYTSGDSVFQIAAHEEVIPVPDLYQICEIAREILTGEYEVSRVIARPFIGEPGNFVRTANRKDFSVSPPDTTLLDILKDEGKMVHAVGKIEDIFNGQGITSAVHTKDNMDGVDQTIDAIRNLDKKGLIFTNLVDFDAKYGHRNNPVGYANALIDFDQRLPEITASLGPEDLIFITADHGNDPTTPSTDHSRELVPVLVTGHGIKAGVNIGTRESFADLAASIAEYLGGSPPPEGSSFLREILS